MDVWLPGTARWWKCDEHAIMWCDEHGRCWMEGCRGTFSKPPSTDLKGGATIAELLS